MNRRQFLPSSLAATALQAQPVRKPNIVWIMADDLGYGDLGCYGQKHIQTPNIDRLAKQGTRFTNAYAGCTVCAPSRSVLMTGHHMGHTSIRSNAGAVPLLATDHTVAQTLKQAGYVCGCFGKWGLGEWKSDGVPEKHGFDRFVGFYNQVHAHNHFPGFLFENGELSIITENRFSNKSKFVNEVFAQEATQFIGEHAKQPFFLYVPFTIPHLGLEAPQDSLNSYLEKIKDPEPYIDPRNHYPAQPYPRATYAAMVSTLDDYVGRILDELKRLNLEKDTIVFFTSDNGSATALWKDGNFFNSTGGLRGHKQNLYEGGIRVPMIARWAGKITAGKTSDFPWMFADFHATAAELGGTKPPLGIDGKSVLPTLLGQKQQPAEFLYWELPRYDAKTGTFPDEAPMQAVRMGKWKAVRPTPGAALELYDLSKDPAESKNLAQAEKAVMAKIENYLKTARSKPRPQKNSPNNYLPG